jgi:ligand-binding sensor domain-containing protein/AraC-like DNA-binding protein
MRYWRIGCFCLLISALPLGASQPRICHGHWNEENGLLGNSVRSLTQTPDGYIWMGMEDGLIRFDGIRFTRFPSHTADNMGSQMVNRCLTDKKGSLWIGTMDQGLIRIQPGPVLGYTQQDGLCSSHVTCLMEASDRTLWIGTSRGLNRLVSGAVQIIPLPPKLSAPHISSIVEDERGQVWAATYDQGLLRISERGQEMEIESIPWTESDINVLLPLDDHSLWIGTMGRGLYRFDTDTQNRRREQRPGNVSITCLYTDSARNNWIGTYGDGIYLRPGGQDEVIPFQSDGDDPPSKIISAFLEDREYSLWVATLGGGAYTLRKAAVTTLTGKSGLSGDIIFGVFEDSRGRIWSGSIGGGVNCTDETGTKTLTGAQGFPSQSVLSFSETADGSIWMAAVGHGLIRYKDGKLTVYNQRHGLPDTLIRALFTDRHDRLWIGTQQGNLYRREGAGFRKRLHLDARINHIHEEPNGNMLLCTMGQGVVVYTETPGQAHHAPMAGLPGKLYTHVHRDLTGNLWLAAIGQGLLVKTPTGQIQLFNRQDGLPDHTIYVILEDETGRIWCSCNHGVFSISRPSILARLADPNKPLHVTVYGKESGMRSLECNGGSQPAGLRDRKGRLWFPTIKGLARLTPSQIHINLTPPSVLIERVCLDDQICSSDQAMVLRSRGSELKIDFTAISFVYPQRVRFRHRLDGFDKDWIEGQTERSVRYQNLPAGQYRFRLLAANADGLWNTEETQFSLTLRQAFTQTRFFQGLILMLLAGTAVLLHLFLRQRYLQRRIRPKYHSTPLNPTEADGQLDMLNRLMEGEHLYRQASLSVKDLSQRTLLTTRTISQILNERRKQNFFEYINTFRIREARDIIADPQLRRNRSLLDIAYAVGFNSKSAFNRAFKQVCGHTPSEMKRKKGLSGRGKSKI